MKNIGQVTIFIIIAILVLQVGFVLGEEGEIILGGEGLEILNGQDIKTIKLTEGDICSVEIGDNAFENIKCGLSSFIEIDSSTGEIFNAKFKVGPGGGSYVIGNNEYNNLPENTQIIVEKGIVKITFPDNSEWKTLPKDFDSFFIEGKNIKLPDGLEIINGRVQVTNQGYKVLFGEANYKQNYITVEKDYEQVLIANIDEDMLGYEGNWIKQNSKKFEAQSFEKGSINLEVLEGHEILNTDGKDKLNIEIKKGDGLLIRNKNVEGLIPQFIHKSSETGETSIKNNGFNFNFNDKGFSIEPPEELTTEKIWSGKYQSAPFEISSDSKEINSKIRFNAYRQFVVLSKEDNERISFNKWDLPVSNRIKDNELQTIGQLREKYPEIEITLPEFIPGKGFLGLPVPNGFEEDEDLPPYLVYFTDVFLNSNPNVVENIEAIEYSDLFTAYAESEKGNIMLGLKMVDPISKEFKDLKIREITNPLNILEHEYGHIHQGVIKSKEDEIFKNSENRKISHFLREKEFLKEKQKELLEIGESYKPFSDELIEANKEIKELNKEIEVLDVEMKKHHHRKYNQKTLQQIYNELALDARKDLFSEENVNLLLNVEEKIEKDYVNKKLDQILKKTYGKSLIDWSVEKYEYENPESFLSDFKENEMIYHKMIVSNLLDEQKIDGKDIKKLEDINLILFKAYGFKKLKKEDLSHADKYEKFASFYGISAQNPELSLYVDQLNDVVRQSTGLPYQYALRNYKEGDNPYSSSFSEISTTFLEQPTDIIKQRMNSNSKIKETYEILAQLAFDSGEMGLDKYKKILGENICQRPDCLDKKCVEYKMVCCIDYPNSPNC